MKKIVGFFLFFIAEWQLFGQGINISGFIRDDDGQPIEEVIITDYTGKKLAESDKVGNFSVKIRYPEYLCFSKVGMIDTCLLVTDTTSLPLQIKLSYKVTRVKDVVVTGERSRIKSITSTRLGTTEIRVDSIKRLPTLSGEVDPLKVIQLTPGVGKFDLASGLLVRGSTMDQNLVVFDEGIVYNPTHLAGFISMFNPYVVEKITLTKTGLPVDYGGRVSSLLVAESDKNRVEKTKIDGNIGFLLSNITVRSPIGDRCQTTLAFRQAYLDHTIKPVSKFLFPNNNRSLFNSSQYSFYDGNLLINYRATSRDNIFISSYVGGDDFSIRRAAFDLNYNMKWNNQMASIQWMHYYNSHHISRTSAYYTRSYLSLFIGQNNFNYRLISNNEDYSIKHEHRLIFERLRLKGGIQALQQLVIPNKSEAVLNELEADFGTPNDFHTRTLSAYFESEVAINHKFSVLAGLRGNAYTHVGPYYQFIRDEVTRQIKDTIYYGWGQKVRSYYESDMQISARYRMDSLSAIKFHASRNAQFIQQVNVTTVALPTDFWLPASIQVSPLIAHQLSLGYYKQMKKEINFSVELFYKWFQPVIEFNRGLLQSLSKATMEENLLLGKGRSYGVEYYVEGNIQKWHGWLSYTLSRSERQFAEINGGKAFPSKYDRLHDLTIALMYAFNNRWKGSMVFVYASGQATTLPVGRYMVGGNIVNQYTEYNSFRMPAYHRMDVAVSRILKDYRGVTHELVFSIYNLYSRLNPYFMYYKVSGDLDRYKLMVTPRYVSLFPMMPSVSYRFSY